MKFVLGWADINRSLTTTEDLNNSKNSTTTTRSNDSDNDDNDSTFTIYHTISSLHVSRHVLGVLTATELDTGRVHRRVGSGWVTKFSILDGSGRVQYQKNLINV